MKNTMVAFVAGLVFGLGLMVAGMTQPAKVIAFLDVTGDWDPSLAFVMVGAIAVHFVAYQLVPRIGSPLGASTFAIPTNTRVDRRLLMGAVLFGLGWGLGGYCPGPALTSLATGTVEALTFAAAMLAGMGLFTVYEKATASKT